MSWSWGPCGRGGQGLTDWATGAKLGLNDSPVQASEQRQV